MVVLQQAATAARCSGNQEWPRRTPEIAMSAVSGQRDTLQ
jgi:hypothetical protein